MPPDAGVQSRLLGGVDWMTGKGRRECIPPVYAEWVGTQLAAEVQRRPAIDLVDLHITTEARSDVA